MLIRPATLRDADAISELVCAAYAPYVARIGKPPAPMLEDYRQVIENAQVHVLERDGIQGVLVLERDGERLLLQNVAVAASVQGLGLGRQLMSFAEQQALEQGCTAIELYTNEAMSGNVLFYERLGYRQARRAVEQGYARVFMGKAL